ncbi:hypothetical protein MMC11_003506 [Xylographa trunciseda]|nr:hypothetical protein [Xylographa trunciseda]
MLDLLRDAPFGQAVRYLTRNKVFQYPEEQTGFQCPTTYTVAGVSTPTVVNGPGEDLSEEKGSVRGVDGPTTPALDSNIEKLSDSTSDADSDLERQTSLGIRRTQTLPYTEERLECEQRLAATRMASIPIIPVKTADGVTLVDWYNTNDPANPQNWSQKKKAFVALQIDLYTFVVYCGSSIYVASELGVIAEFGIGSTEASLGLALYVLGYGLGPLLWAPMSEIPTFGRNIPYITSFAIYLILIIPTALVHNYGGLMVLRFLAGFFGSPCLANGGASMQDMYSLLYLPYAVSLWVSFAFAAPALGPTISTFAVVAESWRWSFWETLWMSGPIFLLWIFCLPETSPSTILLYRAARLRQKSGNKKIRSQTEIDRQGLSPRAIAMDAVIKPFEIMFKDPAVMFTNVYTALTYGIYYSFFEVFPLVYGPLYGFNAGETGLVFISIVIGCVLGMIIYYAYLYFSLIPDIKKNGLRAQEWRLRPALPAVFVFTLSLFAFGWTANANIHWAAGVIFLIIYAASIYIILQCIFVYIPMSYPQYAASLFASNDFCRSIFAFAAVLFASPMYRNVGIGQGVSIVGGLSVLGIVGIWLLYFYGAKLRARSKFALS